jgi:hypothetical protein
MTAGSARLKRREREIKNKKGKNRSKGRKTTTSSNRGAIITA